LIKVLKGEKGQRRFHAKRAADFLHGLLAKDAAQAEAA
jgi:hypothetical protein